MRGAVVTALVWILVDRTGVRWPGAPSHEGSWLTEEEALACAYEIACACAARGLTGQMLVAEQVPLAAAEAGWTALDVAQAREYLRGRLSQPELEQLWLDLPRCPRGVSLEALAGLEAEVQS